jgi:hypothetical protein
LTLLLRRASDSFSFSLYLTSFSIWTRRVVRFLSVLSAVAGLSHAALKISFKLGGSDMVTLAII